MLQGLIISNNVITNHEFAHDAIWLDSGLAISYLDKLDELVQDRLDKTCWTDSLLTAPKTQMTNMFIKKETARAMVDSMELYLMPSFTSTGSFLEMARL